MPRGVRGTALNSYFYLLFLGIFFLLAALLMVLPVFYYLLWPWRRRRDRLFSFLDDASVLAYYEQFHKGVGAGTAPTLATFERHFGVVYGRRNYLPPLVLLVIATILAALVGTPTVLHIQGLVRHPYAMSLVAASALAGGYAWAAQDLLDRTFRGDLNAVDIYRAVARILLAIPLGWSLAQVAKEPVGAPIAFLIAGFPTGTIFKFGRRIVSSKLGMGDDPDTGLELEKLQSVTKTNAERFYDAGVSTIVQLAYADPIDLCIRTGFDFNYVIDCASQALLWIYMGDLTPKLAKYSLRGAQEVHTLVQDLEDPASKVAAEALVQEVATLSGVSAVAMKATFEQVAEDPYTKFILSIWH